MMAQRRRPRRETWRERWYRRSVFATRTVIATLLFTTLVIIDMIGDPPRFRITPLWVKGHEAEVRLAMQLTAVALLLTALDALWTRRPLVPLLVWLVWIGVIWGLFAERVVLIMKVVNDHMW
ncbi:MAG: hypothetical protein AAF432_04630 [Planctomycetota bacterium]